MGGNTENFFYLLPLLIERGASSETAAIIVLDVAMPVVGVVRQKHRRARLRRRPQGKRSDTTPSIVGQKNVLPTPHTVAEIQPDGGISSQSKPSMANTAQENKEPNGEILWTIGPAKRSANMMLEV